MSQIDDYINLCYTNTFIKALDVAFDHPAWDHLVDPSKCRDIYKVRGVTIEGGIHEDDRQYMEHRQAELQAANMRRWSYIVPQSVHIYTQKPKEPLVWAFYKNRRELAIAGKPFHTPLVSIEPLRKWRDSLLD